jgi:hypothetical protein
MNDKILLKKTAVKLQTINTNKGTIFLIELRFRDDLCND